PAPPASPEQAPTFGTTPATGPAKRPSLSFWSWLGKSFTSLAETLFGYLCWMMLARSGLMALEENPEPTPERSTTTDPKNNNLCFRIGPPMFPFASLRRNTGTLG